MVLMEDAGDSKFYRRESDKLAIGAAELKRIVYGFYKGRFYYLIIGAEGISNWVGLRDAVFATYGEGYKSNRFIDDWDWGMMGRPPGVKEVRMGLEYSEISKKSSMHMFYTPIDAERDADKAKVAKEAKKDF